MNIIAQSGATVNIYCQKRPLLTNQRLAKAKRRYEERKAEGKRPTLSQWRDHKTQCKAIGERMIKAGMKKRGYAIMACNREMLVDACRDCGHIYIRSASLCRDRLCPLCAWRLAVKRYGAMSDIMARLMDDGKMQGVSVALVTLTVQTCDLDKLRATMDTMQEAWNGLTAQRSIRKHLLGWAKSIEVTYSDRLNQLHPHYHLISIADDEITHREIVDQWLRLAAVKGLKVSIKAQSVEPVLSMTPGKSLAGEICEVYKYAVKAADLLEMPLAALRALATGLYHRRLVSMGGIIKQYAGDVDLDSADERDGDIDLCTDCGSVEVDHLIATWSMLSSRYILSPADLPELSTDDTDDYSDIDAEAMEDDSNV